MSKFEIWATTKEVEDRGGRVHGVILENHFSPDDPVLWLANRQMSGMLVQISGAFGRYVNKFEIVDVLHAA